MKYSKERPLKTGWYWIWDPRLEEHDICQVVINNSNGKLCIENDNGELFPVDKSWVTNCLFAGPLTPPTIA